MRLKQIAEISYKFYNNGRISATNQTLRQADIEQMCSMALGSMLRQKYYEGKSLDEGTDFLGGELDTKEYPLSEPNFIGMRRAVIKDEVLRLPRSVDIVNVYGLGECSGEDWDGQITQVQPGEENFYLTADYSFYKFFVQKGRGINTYHIPPCVKKIAVERIYFSNDLDVPIDIAFDVATQVLGISLKMKEFLPTADNPMDGNRNQLRYQLEKQNEKV